VTIHQDALIYAGILSAADSISYAIAPTRLVYLHVATGELCVNGIRLLAGDALKISDISSLLINDAQDAEILLFDMSV
jgi:redox-sensitive bicupin YhaK (pirin superfamily)